MLTFPHAKINLGLHVVSKRADGFHNLVTCFYPFPWTDALEILPSKKVRFTQTGLSIPGGADNNLCLKAYNTLRKDFRIPPAQLHLHKVIPTGAGLGGGSSDAAFTIKILNDIFSLALPENKMMEYAAKIGSDCPFFIQEKPVLAKGTGNIFENIDLTLKGYFLVVINPKIHITTAEAYGEIEPKAPDIALKDILALSPQEWRGTLRNDFEIPLFEKFPELESIKQQLYEMGAVYASMSGSGSSMYALFEAKTEVRSIFPQHYSFWEGIL